MADIVFVKYCPLCGAENPRQQAFCLTCLDGDLSMAPIEARREATPEPDSAVPLADPSLPTATTLTLELVENPTVRFSVCENQTVGRNAQADIVLCEAPKLEWISSIHARFLRRGAQWYIQHLGTTNFIKVDGETYTGQEEVAVYHNSVVVFSLTAFRVDLEGC